MLRSLDARSDWPGMNGRGPDGIAELRRQLARPSQLDDEYRRRLLELVQQVARIQALGGEYSRVSLSDFVLTAIRKSPAVA